MRLYMIIPSLVLILGCKKSSTSSTASNASTFQFTVNGTVYQMNGNLADSTVGAELIRQIGVGCSLTDTTYELNAMDSAQDWVQINTTPLSSLTVTTYTDSLTLVPTGPNSNCINSSGGARIWSYSSTWYYVAKPGDYTTIVVKSIHDGMADGTFTGQFTANGPGPGIPASMTITNGQFKNIPIVN